MGDYVSGERAFAAEVEPVRALHVSVHLAHDDYFASADAGLNLAVASNGDTVVGDVDGTFDLAVDEERLGAADLALDDQRASDGGLLHGGAGGLHRGVGVWVRGELGIL